MKQRTAFWIAWSVWALSMGALLVPFAYRLMGHRVTGFGDQSGSIAAVVTVLLFIPSFATVGAVLSAKRPTNPVGWLLSASGLCYALGTLAVLVGSFSTRWSNWLGWVWGVGIGITGTFVLLLFPTGTLPSRRWRPVAWLAGVALGGTFLGNAFTPGVIQGSHSINPLGIGGPAGAVFRVLQGSFGLVFPAGLAALVSLVFRFRRAQFSEREQIKWLVYAGALIVIAVIAGTIVADAVGPGDLADNLQNAILSGSFVFVPLAIGVAILKYHLYDIDVVINKTVVYAGLAAFITAVYVAIVVGIGTLVGQGGHQNLGLSIAATAVVAVGFQPVRERVQKLANRLVYGKRATPYEVLSEFSSRMGGTYAAEDLLPRMARILAEGTGAATARVWLKVGPELVPEAAWPEDAPLVGPMPAHADEAPVFPEATASYSVHHRGELLGALTLTKPPGERLTPAEDKLAADLASQAGLVLRNVRLTEELLARLEELQASRQRIVAAQDQERRRLERNIHDGAQQQLVALAVKVRLARQISATNPQRASELLEQTEGEVTDALQDLRDLARGIYPPLLADQGLAAALRSQARKAAIPVEIDSDGILRYPQEAEAAVYFCALEALQNVAKYSGAAQATVRLHEESDSLIFEVEDDGTGFDPATTRYGTGLQGMADRLAALGGELSVVSSPGRGTIVRGTIPVQLSTPERASSAR
jgi:signal transduction histidine kinase